MHEKKNLLLRIIVTTEHSNKVVVARNLVVKFLVPVVLLSGYFAVVWSEAMQVATAEAKPKNKKFLFSERGRQKYVYPVLLAIVGQHDMILSHELAAAFSMPFSCVEIFLEYNF